MKVLLIITFLVTCAGSSSAQTIKSTDAPPGVVILELKWRELLFRMSSDSPYSASNRTLEGVPAQPRKPASSDHVDPPTKKVRTGPSPRIRQYMYQVKIKNTGTKRIEALRWEYVFVDPVTQEELDQHSFQSFERIKPDKSPTLTGISAAPPTKIVTVGGLEKDSRKPFDERVVITCALYSDGSVWTNPSREDTDCAHLKERAQTRKK